MAVALASMPAFAATAHASQRLGSRTLKQGMRGADVRTLQTDLAELGFTATTSGVFDANTTAAVKKFERAYGLKVKGVVDSSFVNQLDHVLAAPTGGAGIAPAATSHGSKAVKTTAASLSPSANPNIPVIPHDGGSQHLGERVLRNGMRGHDVRVLQAYLTMGGYSTPVSGWFGPITLTHVKQFQAAHGFKANGVVSYAVAFALRVVDAGQTQGGSFAKATINSQGLAVAPASAPPAVKEIIAAANQIAHKPYIYGGGHASWNDAGYDCSGSTSYALHGAGLISSPEDSTEFESYGSSGVGQWVTLWANSGHVYMEIAGLWYDTAAQSSQNQNDRWSTQRISPAGGFVERHPTGL
ncbi:MAG TPA: peptidoglycan-binding domain-containing protein [Solirubrobacteraceae bacterium]|nr:peptidoglycan-binding domain-containing protein [Solirubrobacteraceae bacterium]